MKLKLTTLLILITSYAFAQSTTNKVITEIRKEFKLINEDKTLTTKTINSSDRSTEGGEITVYTNAEGDIRKITEANYGEMGKVITDYYIKNNILIFSFSQRYKYNRPIYWGKEQAEEFGETEVFDISKSIILENRYYFNSQKKMVRWINEGKKTIEDHNQLIDIEKEIHAEFNKLIETISVKQ